MDLTVTGPQAGSFRWTLVLNENRDNETLSNNLRNTLGSLDGSVQLWVRSVDPAADGVVRSAGFEPYRDLWQLRCPLPNRPSGIETHSYSATDLLEFISLNNRAFHWHPEQGSLTPESVEKTMSEPWFDPDGFRLLRDEEELIGFCWTKIHRNTHPELGEIYAIAIDPSHHGSGLGKPMTLAGLEWLAAQGLEWGMLYVEADNAPANATYKSLGFEHHHTDRAYQLDLDASREARRR